MKERPILFSSAMVRAILEGRKTQTRRVMKFDPHDGYDYANCEENLKLCPYGAPGDTLWVRENWKLATWDWEDNAVGIRYPADGEVISQEMPDGWDDNGEWMMREVRRVTKTPDAKWIREGRDGTEIEVPHKEAQEDCWLKWEHEKQPERPSIFLPRWASRLTLEIVSVRVERLNEISEADADAEGVETIPEDFYSRGGEALPMAFKRLLESINGPGSWALNEWVWVLEFRKL